MSDSSQPPQQRDFYCPSCNGRIVIPFSLPATTAPCPHCQATITSPPPPYQQPQSPHPSQAPSPTNQPAQQDYTNAPAPAIIPPRREKTPQPQERPQEATRSQEEETQPSRSNGTILAILGLLLLILAGGAAVFYISRQDTSTKPLESSTSLTDDDIREANYIRVGWQKDAYAVLEGFIEGTSVAEKIPFVHQPEVVRPKMESFYGDVAINDSDTPADSFSVLELTEEDRRKGIFMLTYDLPPQFSLKDFFRPITSLEVQYGINEADILLGTMGQVRNFALEPVRVYAFFKKTPAGLKLDWEVFAQTKYRTLRSFTEFPKPGNSEVFRVMIVEDVPEKGQGIAGTRTYRIFDPANVSDSIRVNVKVDSNAGRELSVINWRGTKQAEPVTRTATVELMWTSPNGTESPQLVMKRFVCWEFLGLGGKEIPTTASAE